MLLGCRTRRSSQVIFDHAQFVIPHPRKVEKGGEDAAFSRRLSLGVADGVGGWEAVGVDPSKYSRELLRHVEDILDSEWDSDLGGSSVPSKLSSLPPKPVEVMRRASVKVKAVGSSTCCLVFLDPIGRSVQSANLGDSGFLLYRPEGKTLLYRTEDQLHGFNFPLQLGTGSSDLPEHSETMDCPVEPGDILLLATDGVFDNVFDEDLLRLIDLNGRMDVEKLAAAIAFTAYKHSLDPRYKSPFSVKEMGHFGESTCFGGKSDDISVVMARVRES